MNWNENKDISSGKFRRQRQHLGVFVCVCALIWAGRTARDWWQWVCSAAVGLFET